MADREHSQTYEIRPHQELRPGVSWLVQPALSRISDASHTHQIEPKVMEVLQVLVDRSGEVVSKAELLDTVWADVEVVDSVLTRSVSALRKVFHDDARSPVVIETISKRGYRFIGELEAQTDHRVAGPSIDQPTVAILPVRAQQSDEQFAEQFSEQLIADLALIKSIAVVSSTSTRVYRNSHKRLPVIALELGADYVVESSIQRLDRTVHVTIRLIEAASDCHQWSGSYDLGPREWFSVQTEIARQLASAMGASLQTAGPQISNNRVQISSQARDAYRKGLYFWLRRSEDNDRKAVAAFDEAIKFDPTYADAHAALADCHTVFAIEGSTQIRETHLQAKEHALTALEHDPYSGLAHASLGSIRFFFEWDITGATTSFRRALNANPSNAEALLSFAEVLSACGEHEESRELSAKACRLNPLDPSYYSNQAILLSFSGDLAGAARSYRQSLDLECRSRVWASLAKTLALKGDRREALEALEQSETTVEMVDDLIGITHYLLGDSKQGEAALQRFVDQYAGQPGMAYRHTRLLAAAGKTQEAVETLKIAFDDLEPWGVYSAVDPVLKSLHSDTGFLRLIKQKSLPLPQAGSR